jgi:hypothetical protein
MLPFDETLVDDNMKFRKGQQSDHEMEIHAHMKTPNTKMLLCISNIKAFLPFAEPI